MLVSYYTPLYLTGSKRLYATLQTLQAQTNPNWEWVLMDDSPADHTVTEEAAKQICQNEYRVHYYRISPCTGGNVGEAKFRATSLCNGELLAELDHDDLLGNLMTQKLIDAADKYPECGFFYTDCIFCEPDFNTANLKFPKDFALGYGQYERQQVVQPLTGETYFTDVIIAAPINPATIRHIVGVPNHIRCWRKDTLQEIGGYNRKLEVADDFELLIRTFINTGMCHIRYYGYFQLMYGDNTQIKKQREIQQNVHLVSNVYHKAIADRFEELGFKDFIYEAQPQYADNLWMLTQNNPVRHDCDVELKFPGEDCANNNLILMENED